MRQPPISGTGTHASRSGIDQSRRATLEWRVLVGLLRPANSHRRRPHYRLVRENLFVMNQRSNISLRWSLRQCRSLKLSRTEVVIRAPKWQVRISLQAPDEKEESSPSPTSFVQKSMPPSGFSTIIRRTIEHYSDVALCKGQEALQNVGVLLKCCDACAVQRHFIHPGRWIL